MLAVYLHNRDSYLAQQDASPLPGMAGRRIYKYVCEDLGVPLLRTAMVSECALRASLFARYGERRKDAV